MTMRKDRTIIVSAEGSNFLVIDSFTSLKEARSRFAEFLVRYPRACVRMDGGTLQHKCREGEK